MVIHTIFAQIDRRSQNKQKCALVNGYFSSAMQKMGLDSNLSKLVLEIHGYHWKDAEAVLATIYVP